MSPVKRQKIVEEGSHAVQVLSPEALAVADQLHSAAIHLLRRLRIRDLASGIGPAQLSALSVLVFGGTGSLGELAKAEQVRPPTMSRIVASLERSGLVRRHSTEDARRVRLEATPKGIKLMQAARARRIELLAQTLARLPEREIHRLADLTRLLNQLLRSL
jgi:DNA-binding MarR family transcriptional regulator